MSQDFDQEDENVAVQELEVQVQMPPEIQRGVYANQMIVSHTQEEFILDFLLVTPPSGTINSRVLVSPSHAKRIVAALSENIANYEKRFGPVQDVKALLPEGVRTH